MKRKVIFAGALTALALSAAASSALAQQTAYQRGIQIGMSRGYAPVQLECYANIFARRASLSPRGQWVMEPDANFADELWRRCRISR